MNTVRIIVWLGVTGGESERGEESAAGVFLLIRRDGVCGVGGSGRSGLRGKGRMRGEVR